MDKKPQHYSTSSPDSNVKVFTISESLRRHLYIFKTVSGVFSYQKLDLGTKILIEHMTIPQHQSDLLDLGCGYGPIGIVLGYESINSRIYFIDTNKRAIWCTKENVKLNLPDSKGRIKIMTGDYLEPIKNKNLLLDGIYLNPPLRKGREEFIKLSKEIRDYLKPDGFFEFVIKKKMGASFILKLFEERYPDNNTEIICKRSGYWVFHFSL